jgi:hypothetical protein
MKDEYGINYCECCSEPLEETGIKCWCCEEWFCEDHYPTHICKDEEENDE